MAQFSQRLGFDLADAFASHGERLTHFSSVFSLPSSNPKRILMILSSRV